MQCVSLKLLILEQLVLETQQKKCSNHLYFNFCKMRVVGSGASEGLVNFFPLIIMHSLSSVPQLLPKQNSADT